MKLLGWMHRKFRQNSGDQFRDFSSGNPCNCLSGRRSLDGDHHHYYNKPSKAPQRPIPDEWFLPTDEDPGDPAVGYPEENALSSPITELFHGLLTIGTLGSPAHPGDGSTTGAATPTFGVPPASFTSVDDIAEKEEYEATEDDLMLINAELEKVLLLPEAEKSDFRLSSARTSQVSAKQLVVSGGCPLQEYLLAELVDTAETTEATAAVQQQKKESHHHNRTSLGELFMKSRIVEEVGGGGGKKEEKPEKPAAAGVQLIVKKMLKRRGPSGSSRSSSGDGFVCGADGDGPTGQSVASETKFHKIMQMFHRKVHPENSVAAKKAALKSSKCLSRRLDIGRHSCGDISSAAMSGALRKDNALLKRQSSISPSASVNSSGTGDSSGNREHWIKTDADYLVLEL